MRFALSLIPLALIVGTVAYSQETCANLSGTISDATGAVVTEARIRLINRETSVTGRRRSIAVPASRSAFQLDR